MLEYYKLYMINCHYYEVEGVQVTSKGKIVQ